MCDWKRWPAIIIYFEMLLQQSNQQQSNHPGKRKKRNKLKQFRRRLRRAWGFSRKQARAIEPVWGMGYTPAECADEAVYELAEASR